MDLNGIIAELESFNLEREETRNAAGNLQASVTYFFEQLQSRSTWTTEELNLLKDQCKIDRSLEILESALFEPETTEAD